MDRVVTESVEGAKPWTGCGLTRTGFGNSLQTHKATHWPFIANHASQFDMVIESTKAITYKSAAL